MAVEIERDNIASANILTDTISWRAIFAGAFVALITYMALMALGLAFGGGALQGVIQGNANANSLGVGAGIWMIVSVLVSLFVGSYVSARVGFEFPIRVGRYQGVVIASLFFIAMFSELGAAVGALGGGLGSAVATVGSKASDAAETPIGQDVVDNALKDLKLNSPPDEVARGVAVRLVRGDEDGALNYLSRQANISPQEARARLDSFKADVKQKATDAGVAAAKGIKVAGTSIFFAILLGTLAAMGGGGFGAAMSLRKPLSKADRKAIDNRRAA